MTIPTDDEKAAYKRGRAAIRNLRKDRNFQWWIDYGTAADAARHEAMRAAYTNKPIGKAYNMEHARIMKREALIDLSDPNHPFPDANSRKDAIIVVENMHHPVDSRYLKGVKAWREGLTLDERNKLNHPTRILGRWRKDTKPKLETTEDVEGDEDEGNENEAKKSKAVMADVYLKMLEENTQLREEIKKLEARIQELEEELRIARGGAPAPKPEPKWTEADQVIDEVVAKAIKD
jgi:hypothetical protein